MTTPFDWARRGWQLGPRWLSSIHPNDGTKLRRVLNVCDGHWRTSREVTRLSGLKGGTVRPLLFAAARKQLLLRRPARAEMVRSDHLFAVRWQYRRMGT